MSDIFDAFDDIDSFEDAMEEDPEEAICPSSEEEHEESDDDDVGSDTPVSDDAAGAATGNGCAAVFVSDVLLPLELARLEGLEATRIDAGADLVSRDTGGSSVALELATRFVGHRDPTQRPPYVVVRSLPGRGAQHLSIRAARIARSVCEMLPSP
jgi:hypothetical protein